MSLTQYSNPAAANHAAFNTVLWGVTSTRADVLIPTSVTSISNSGGKLRCVGSAHGLESNDIVTLSGFTGLTTLKSRVTVINSTTVDCVDIAYSAYPLSSATIQKTINNLNIRCDVKVWGIIIGSKYTKTQVATAFEFDISGILQDYINAQSEGVDIADTTVQAITSASTVASAQYTLTFSEYYDDYQDIPYLGSQLSITKLSGSVMRAHNFAVQTGGAFSDYILSGTSSKVLTNIKTKYLRTGEKFTFQFLTTLSQVKLRIVRYTAGTGASTIGSAVTINNCRGTVTIDSTVFTTGVDMVEVTILNTSNTAISETLTFYPDASNVRTASRVQFKNLLGGFDSIYFADNSQALEVEAADLRTDGNYKTWYVFNDNVYTFELTANNTVLAWLEELALSKVVYLNGKRATPSSRAMTVQSREFVTFTMSIKGERKILN